MRLRKGQAWSLDALIGIAVFVGALLVVIGYLLTTGSKDAQLEEEAELVLGALSNKDSPLSILDGESLNQTKLDALYNMTYESLKSEVRTAYDFCIYLEDENGNVLFFNSSSTGKGSNILNVSDVPCIIG